MQLVTPALGGFEGVRVRAALCPADEGAPGACAEAFPPLEVPVADPDHWVSLDTTGKASHKDAGVGGLALVRSPQRAACMHCCVLALGLAITLRAAPPVSEGGAPHTAQNALHLGGPKRLSCSGPLAKHSGQQRSFNASELTPESGVCADQRGPDVGRAAAGAVECGGAPPVHPCAHTAGAARGAPGQ